MDKNASITKFSSVVSRLRTYLASKSMYSMWIRFKVGSLDIDTSSQNLYGNHANYMLSLENVKNGSGCVNSFTVSIAYVPKFGDDPDLIDKALSFSDRKCTLQYGYGVDDFHTDEYVGQILDYSVEIRNNMLYYTITGYSSITPLIDSKLSFDAIDSTADSESRRPTVVAKNAIEKYLTEYKISDYKVVVDDNVKDLAEDSIEAASDISLFDYVSSILKLARDETQPNTEEVELNERITYTYTISDYNNSSGKSINITKIDPSEEQSIKIIFNWMDKNDNLVIDFKTDFSGAILLNRNYVTQDGVSVDKYTINEKGEAEKVTTKVKESSYTSGSTSDKDASSTSYTWAEAVQHSYTATLSLVGIPCEIPLGTIIEVVPLIYGKPHHTQGRYMVTKTTDTLDSSGFRTTLEMFKLNAEETTYNVISKTDLAKYKKSEGTVIK